VRRRRPSARRLTAGILLAAFLPAVCACGSHAGDNGVASETPVRVMERAEAAARDAATVHVSGSVAGPGQRLGIDMELVRGHGGRGTVSVDGLRAQLVQDAGWIYVKPNPALLKQLVGAPAAGRLAGRWLKGPADHGPLAPLASLTDLPEVVTDALRAHAPRNASEVVVGPGRGAVRSTILATHPGLTRAGTRTIAGHPAVALRDPSTGATLYVSATGNPYPLALVKPGANGGGLTFARWNREIALEAPPNPLNIKAVFSLKGL